MENNTPLPSNYIKQYDPNYQRDYYVNTLTGISTWEDPRLSLSNPPPYVPNDMNGSQNQFNQHQSLHPSTQNQMQHSAQNQYRPQGIQNQYPHQPQPAYGGNQPQYAQLNSQQPGGYQQYIQGNGYSQQQYGGKPQGSGGLDGLISQAGPIIASLVGGKKQGKPGKMNILGFKF